MNYKKKQTLGCNYHLVVTVMFGIKLKLFGIRELLGGRKEKPFDDLNNWLPILRFKTKKTVGFEMKHLWIVSDKQKSHILDMFNVSSDQINNMVNLKVIQWSLECYWFILTKTVKNIWNVVSLLTTNIFSPSSFSTKIFFCPHLPVNRKISLSFICRHPWHLVSAKLIF